MNKLFLHFLLFFTVGTIVGAEQLAITKALQEHLTKELDNADAAQKLAAIIVEDTLLWKSTTIPLQEIRTIIAYAFGNRILPNGNRLPGPTNQELAHLVVQLHKETNAPVYAQWEVAEAIGDRIPSENMTVIYPTLDSLANVVYLNTLGVASAIASHSGDVKKLGKVAVIAFNDHLHRCIKTSKSVGIDAHAPEGYAMPSTYDAQSGQPWTRDRLAYLVTDIKTRITNSFEKLTKH
jgi:hypothetical protein